MTIKRIKDMSKLIFIKINILLSLFILGSIKKIYSQISIKTEAVSDCRKSDGKAVITVVTTATGLELEYSVDGGPFQSSGEFSDLSTGDHFAIVRSKNSHCDFSKDFTIGEAENSLNINISGFGTTEFCNNAKPPTITLTATASGGSGDYEYSWPGGSIQVRSSGRQSVMVTDKKTGCKESLGGDVVFIPIVCSRDPNDIIGPEGYGKAKMVSRFRAHSYMIRFENDPDFATAPAQVVKINHPLDSNVNPFSLRLSDFGFGGLTFTVPPDKTFYAGRLNVIDSLGIVVDVTAGIDVAKREAFWIFESKDPATGLPPTNAQLGFLPVNDSSAKGEGYVNYTIKAASHTQTGDSIHAKASIVFDLNAPIETPVIFNTIDAVAPTSTVSALPVATDSTTIPVKWTGHDDPGGSGVRDYSLYVAKNGGVFSIYQSGITDSVTNFTGSPGNTYGFYTIASDNTGNIESAKITGEQTVTIKQPKKQSVFYHDADNDNFGNRPDTVHAFDSPAGYVADSADCDDANKNVHPGAAEICNGIDDDCDGQIDEEACGSQPPIVRITAPADSAVFIAGGNINFAAAASDEDGTISKVEFYNGTNLLYTATDTPYAFKWQNVGTGKYTLTVKATDNRGLVTISPPIYISVVANKPPAVNIINPADNQTFLKGATIHLQAAAHDSDGTVSKVEFYSGATLLATTYRPPYKFDWTIGRLGNFRITARATDNYSTVTTSEAINVSVLPNKPPVVSIIKPGDGESFTAPATINFEIAAQDTDGRIIQVRLYNGTSLLLTNEYKFPYTYKWHNVPAGTYTITAVAKDNWTAETTSAPKTITVVSPGTPSSAKKPSSVDIKTGIRDVASIRLVPNPARNILNIYTTGLQQNKQLTVSIISPLGKLLKTMQTTSSNQVIQLNVSSLVSGVYTMKVLCADEILYKQFIKL